MQNYTGSRLREERERLGLSQQAMGEIGGVKKLTQLNYEKGERSPDASYLFAVSKLGVDIQYIVTGVRSSSALSADEEELIGNYRLAPFAVKKAVFAALEVNDKNCEPSSVNVTGGTGNRIAGRDYNENKS